MLKKVLDYRHRASNLGREAITETDQREGCISPREALPYLYMADVAEAEAVASDGEHLSDGVS
jgi:hypothetical protein